MLAGRGAGRGSDFFWVGMDNERIRKRVREKKGVACTLFFHLLPPLVVFFSMLAQRGSLRETIFDVYVSFT